MSDERELDSISYTISMIPPKGGSSDYTVAMVHNGEVIRETTGSLEDCISRVCTSVRARMLQDAVLALT